MSDVLHSAWGMATSGTLMWKGGKIDQLGGDFIISPGQFCVLLCALYLVVNVSYQAHLCAHIPPSYTTADDERTLPLAHAATLCALSPFTRSGGAEGTVLYSHRMQTTVDHTRAETLIQKAGLGNLTPTDEGTSTAPTAPQEGTPAVPASAT